MDEQPWHTKKRKRKRKLIPVIIAVLLIILLALSAFLVWKFDKTGNVKSLFSHRTGEPELKPAVPPVMTTAPTAPPAPTPTPYPEPDMKVAESAFAINGQSYAGGAYLLNGSTAPVYVRLSDLAGAFGSRLATDSTGNNFSITAEGKSLGFTAGEASFTVDGAVRALSGKTIPFNKGYDLYVPADDVLSAIYSAKRTDADGTVHYLAFDPNFTLQEERSIPIFSYYTVADGKGSDYAKIEPDEVKQKSFEEQVRFAKTNGYSLITFEDLANLEQYDKPVMLTFDGCYSDVYSVVYPFIKQENVKINLFVCPEYLDQPGRLTTAQVQEMKNSGLVSLQCASLLDAGHLDKLTEAELTAKLESIKNSVRQLSGKEPLAFAYPIGQPATRLVNCAHSNFRFCVRRTAQRAFDTSKDDGSLIFRFTVDRTTPSESVEYWMRLAK